MRFEGVCVVENTPNYLLRGRVLFPKEFTVDVKFGYGLRLIRAWSIKLIDTPYPQIHSKAIQTEPIGFDSEPWDWRHVLPIPRNSGFENDWRYWATDIEAENDNLIRNQWLMIFIPASCIRSSLHISRLCSRSGHGQETASIFAKFNWLLKLLKMDSSFPRRSQRAPRSSSVFQHMSHCKKFLLNMDLGFRC